MTDLFGITPADRQKYIVFDVETNGLYRDGMAADHPDGPRLAGITMIWTSPGLALEGERTFYIKPEGWYMPQGPNSAGAVNGLTTRFLMDNGRPIADVVDFYNRAISAGYIFCAFNIQFDCKVMRGEMRRLKRPDRREETLTICMMEENRPICKLPYKDPKKNPGCKQPKLSEACAHWKIQQHGAHTSRDDAHATLALLRCLVGAGIEFTPKILTSKENA